jgi:hypothetical protein
VYANPAVEFIGKVIAQRGEELERDFHGCVSVRVIQATLNPHACCACALAR